MVWDAEGALDSVEVQDRLDRLGIDSRPFFHPPSSLPAYQDFGRKHAPPGSGTASPTTSTIGPLNLPFSVDAH